MDRKTRNANAITSTIASKFASKRMILRRWLLALGLGTSMLLFLLLGVLLVNTVLFIRRFIKDKRRIDDIEQHYNACFHPTMMPVPAHTLS